VATRANTALDDLNSGIARQIRALRGARGWSLATLATRAGLSKTIVAKIESGDGNPSLETLLRLAGALDITIGSLLGTERPPGTSVIRRSDAFVRSESGLQARGLWSDGRNPRVETSELLLEPGADYHSKPHPPGTEELVICISGAVSVGPEGDEVELGERDAAHFAADLPHRYRSEHGCVATLVMSYPAAG
jgi:transcriptional regulator with XRE-family HTH domain